VFQQIQAGFARFYEANPGFAGVHYIAADTVEECWQLLRQSAMSVSYESLGHVPSYSAWLSAQDWTPAYRRHRRNLALIGANEPAKRWVLKNPSHLFALDALLAVYPDAIVVQTHRPMRTTLASSCSLSMLATRGRFSPADSSEAGARPKVVVDGVAYGAIENLANLNAVSVGEIRYIGATDATTRFGTGYVGGVILVTTKK